MAGRFTSIPNVGNSSAAQSVATGIHSADGLLACLLNIARHYDLPLTAQTAIAGLPLRNGKLTPSSLERAAGRAGLSVHTSHISLESLSGLTFPCIILTQDRNACVIHKRIGQDFFIYNPQVGEDLHAVPIKDLKSEFAGYCIALKPITQINNSASKATLHSKKGHWFWGVVKSLVPQYTQVSLASLLANSLAVAAPLFMLNVYDRVLPNSAFSTLWILTVGMAIVLGFELIFRILRGKITDNAGRHADVQLASRVFDHVMRMRLDERPQSSGAFANRLREFEVVREFFSSASLIAIIDVFFIFVFLGVISLVGGPMIYIPLTAVCIVLCYGVLIQPFMMKTVRSVQDEAAQKHSLLIEALSGLDTIKASNAEGEVLRRWEGIVDQTSRSTERIRFMSLNIVNLTMLVQQCVSIALVVYGVYLFDAGEITMGAIIAVVMLASRAVAPLGAIATTLSRTQQSLVALRHLNEIMQTRFENEENNYEVARPITKGSIEFSNVTFSYPSTEMASLENASFHIHGGEKIGIIGKVGAGKSTLVQLIAGLYSPKNGTIKIDGINQAQLHTAELRNSMGIVLQDVVLFQGTARENIALGNAGASDEDIVKAAELSGADIFINEHPSGFGLQVGERGQRLSGGQRQFIALARALVKDPPILLLDEPTSAMDSTSELLFMTRLKAASEKKTVILSTHRQSLLSICDKLILMDKGRILAFGSKAKVLDFIQEQAQATHKTKPKIIAAPNIVKGPAHA